MRTLTITGFAYCKPAATYEHGKPNVVDGFTFDYCHMSTEDWGDEYIPAGTAELVITLPENFDPRVGAVDALTKRKAEIMAAFQARMNEIDKQISQFTAIEYVEAT